MTIWSCERGTIVPPSASCMTITSRASSPSAERMLLGRMRQKM